MNINIKKLFCLFLLFFSFSLIAKEDHRVEIQPIAFEKALSIANQGVLKQKENGFVYLDVSNEWIDEVIPLLDHEGIIRARPTASRSIGAHISVFDEKENLIPEELGEVFSFEIKEIRSFTLHTRDGLKKLWVIAVDSLELESLRQKYGLSPKLKNFDYHITLGKQMPSAPDQWQQTEEISPFNFSDESVEEMKESGDFTVFEEEKILQTAAKVNAVGQLKIKGNGFVYLDVPNDFIDQVWQQLPFQHDFTPISTTAKKMGAHISVIYEDEMIAKEIWNFTHAGQWFEFEVKELRYVDKKTASGKERLWLLAADAPALQRLRMHYGLKPKLQNHDFHITIGKEILSEISLINEETQELETASQAA